ncbi:hypothetical protein [Egbenema bharatensis]|uniref:hypothetical protein n=1 Tax=Egbenema bharatensis TaxID=3463334 RepID=UPI003A8A5723
MTYRERITPWMIVRLLPKMQRVVVGRFRRRVDAEGHLRFLRQHIPEGEFRIVFDCPSPESDELDEWDQRDGPNEPDLNPEIRLSGF